MFRERSRLSALWATITLAGAVALFFSWNHVNETLADIFLAAVVGSALVFLYGLRRHARARLIHGPATGDADSAADAGSGTMRTGV